MTPVDGISYRKDAAYLAVVIALVLAFVFAPYLFFGRTLLSSSADASSLYASGATNDHGSPRFHVDDAGAPAWQTEPWLAIEHRIVYEQHRAPFWEPYDGYGAPFAATMQPQPFYPPTFVLAAHPSPSTYNWFIVFRLFLAGWFAALFVLFFVDRHAAACTGIATCLTGYYLVYYDMPHLSVDTTLPMLLWSTELLVRRQSPLRIAATIVAASITYLGGMPETALLVLSADAIYAITRIAFKSTGRIRPFAAFFGAHIGAMLVGSVMLVPFLELEPRSLNQHDPLMGGTIAGLAADAHWSVYFTTELLPLVYGFPWNTSLPGGGFTGTRGFFGCAVLLLSIIAVAAFARNRDARNVVVPTFAVIAIYCVLKRFGCPLVNWTGGLPLFNLIGFSKYIEFVLGDAMAILAGFGVAALRRRLVSAADVLGATALALLLITVLYALNKGFPSGPAAWHFSAAFSTGLIALMSMSALAYFTITRPERARALGAGFAGVVLCEICAGYALPQLWTATALASYNPYAGAPYTRFLDAHVVRDRERTFGIWTLLPNWPGAFGFSDPRALNALYPADYMPFIRAFVMTSPATSDDQFDRFTATRPIAIRSALVQRWLHLSSVGWLMSTAPIEAITDPPGAFLNDLWLQSAPTIPAAKATSVFVKAVSIGGVAENVLFEHPPFDGVTYTTVVPANKPLVRADIGLDPGSYVSVPLCGGPVTFTLNALRGKQLVRTSSMTIDPKHVLAQRRWIPFALDLRAFADKPVTLQFTTAAQDLCSAWAVWGEPRFANAGDTAPVTSRQPAYTPSFSSPGAYVYRITGSLPRVRLVHRATVLPPGAATLAVLTAPSFDVSTTAVVDRAIPALARASANDVVSVDFSTADELTAEVTTSGTSLLVQNDTYYPGWVATVDGAPVPLIRTDGLFRGVVVPAGHHVVSIAYRSRAVALGEVLSLLGLVIVAGLTGWGLIARANRKAPTTESAPVLATR